MAVIKNEWIRGLVDFFFPPLCLGCSEHIESDFDICPACMEKIEYIKHPFCLSCFEVIRSGDKCPVCKDDFLPLYSFGEYTTPLKEIVIQYKFKGIIRSARLFSEYICDRYADLIRGHSCDLLLPIPLHRSRENHRGYNQATVLAEELATRLDYKVDDEILSRVKKRKLQSRLNFNQRADNIKGVFEVDEEARTAENTPVILVDDVVTSGSTVLEAGKTLGKAGYKVVAVISIAHAI